MYDDVGNYDIMKGKKMNKRQLTENFIESLYKKWTSEDKIEIRDEISSLYTARTLNSWVTDVEDVAAKWHFGSEAEKGSGLQGPRNPRSDVSRM
jgi:hypothetical protein